jgi:hypothetical protein
MSTQLYRGYLIEVRYFGQLADYGYMSTITAGHHIERDPEKIAISTASFTTGTAAEDHAFSSARAWIESHPAPWTWR